MLSVVNHRDHISRCQILLSEGKKKPPAIEGKAVPWRLTLWLTRDAGINSPNTICNRVYCVKVYQGSKGLRRLIITQFFWRLRCYTWVLSLSKWNNWHELNRLPSMMKRIEIIGQLREMSIRAQSSSRHVPWYNLMEFLELFWDWVFGNFLRRLLILSRVRWHSSIFLNDCWNPPGHLGRIHSMGSQLET